MTNEDAHDAIVYLLKIELAQSMREGQRSKVATDLIKRIAEGPCPRCDGKGVVNITGIYDSCPPGYMGDTCTRCGGTGKAGL